MNTIQLTEAEAVIMADIFSKTTINVFNIAVTHYNIQGLYERCRNHLVTTYFGGNVLRYSVEMRKLFNKFQTTEQEMNQRLLNQRINSIKLDIRRAKLYKQPYSDLAIQHNELAKQHNENNGGIEQLIKLYLQSNKTKAV